MAYKKVYYGDIYRITSGIENKSNSWLNDINTIYQAVKEITMSNQYQGQSADKIKNYFEEVHIKVLLPMISIIINTFIHQAESYYGGYLNSVDCGSGDNRSINSTTIVYDEINKDGTIKKEIDKLKEMQGQITSDVIGVINSISDLVYIYAKPRNAELFLQLNNALGEAVNLNDRVISFETSRRKDFEEIDRLIAQARKIIDAQLEATRMPIISYISGSINNLYDANQVNMDVETTKEIIKKIEREDGYENTRYLLLNRDKIIAEEEKKDREWIQWITVGVSVVGAATLIIVTAGTASPLVVASTSAIVGGVTKATEKLADNYVENASFVDGMDWNSFGKEVLTSTAVGFVSGYMGAVSQGSAIKQPIEQAVISLEKSALEEATGGIIDICWDIGEGIASNKPIDQMLYDFEENNKEMLKNMTTKGAGEFVEGYLSQTFKIDVSNKSKTQKFSEKVVSSIFKETTEETVETLWDVGDAVLVPDSSETVESIIKRNHKEIVQNIAGSTIKGFFSEYLSPSDNAKNVAGKIVVDTLAGTSDEVVKGVTGRTLDYLNGDEHDPSKIYGDIVESDLKNGRVLVENLGESLAENYADQKYKDDKFYNALKKSASYKNGKVQLVSFGEYAVTTEDYNAAVENAGKGAYKDQTVQDILGLPKDTDLSSAKMQTEKIEKLEKYNNPSKTTNIVTVDGKYTYSKSYYDSVVNVTGKEGYDGKTAHEMLGLSEKIDISQENTTFESVDSSEIGLGKKYEFTRDRGTNATKIHILPHDK